MKQYYFMAKIHIPAEFEQKYQKLLGSEYLDFIECCKTKLPKSIWINSLKIKPEKFYSQFEAKYSDKNIFLKQLPFTKTHLKFQALTNPAALRSSRKACS